jgi:hypothetical protein
MLCRRRVCKLCNSTSLTGGGCVVAANGMIRTSTDDKHGSFLGFSILPLSLDVRAQAKHEITRQHDTQQSKAQHKRLQVMVKGRITRITESRRNRKPPWLRNTPNVPVSDYQAHSTAHSRHIWPDNKPRTVLRNNGVNTPNNHRHTFVNETEERKSSNVWATPWRGHA